ncbi:hypothetical protein [Pontibacter sp. G13]|uniref:hypothetical protein n=1 Tax=Pontibacter sp. G13 TaxID=3074898 RepID=UPI00288A3B17|nr:hypothetical protein [Pontibacter sp. G13]WNJ20490.1 hypothetical protein RJD25_08410 [Pontibacter sp. G13]
MLLSRLIPVPIDPEDISEGEWLVVMNPFVIGGRLEADFAAGGTPDFGAFWAASVGLKGGEMMAAITCPVGMEIGLPMALGAFDQRHGK